MSVALFSLIFKHILLIRVSINNLYIKCLTAAKLSAAVFKETLNKSRLSAERTSCPDIFRHFCQKFLEIRQYYCVTFVNLTKNPAVQSARSI